ncbi:hypothetical protein M885DRAFT_578627 [Pelagophyceae sp. CCMP2097]|nr:hypothetical protein M885DRAFT_578627 [Pelagophyceae sp. CCMP2097]
MEMSSSTGIKHLLLSPASATRRLALNPGSPPSPLTVDIPLSATQKVLRDWQAVCTPSADDDDAADSNGAVVLRCEREGAAGGWPAAGGDPEEQFHLSPSIFPPSPKSWAKHPFASKHPLAEPFDSPSGIESAAMYNAPPPPPTTTPDAPHAAARDQAGSPSTGCTWSMRRAATVLTESRCASATPLTPRSARALGPQFGLYEWHRGGVAGRAGGAGVRRSPLLAQRALPRPAGDAAPQTPCRDLAGAGCFPCWTAAAPDNPNGADAR